MSLMPQRGGSTYGVHLGRPPAEYSPVEFKDRGGRSFDRHGGRSFPRVLAQLLAAERVPGQHPQRCRQLVGSPWGKKQTIDPVGDELGRPPRPGCNHRQAGSHSLQHDLAKGFRNGRCMDQDVQMGKLLPDVVAETGEPNSACNSKVLYEPAELLPVCLLPEERRPDYDRFRSTVWEGLGEGCEEDMLAFPGSDPPDHADTKRSRPRHPV